jgi:DNA-binding LytR/AlgR family response regulator
MLEQQGIAVIGEAENGIEALRATEDLRPDLLFLDVQMPGLTGMQAAAALLQLESPPLLIFVTGYSEHAVAAFEHSALDYLVKPVSPDRLAITLARARERMAHQHKPSALPPAVEKEAAITPLRRLPVREDYAVRLVRVEEILCATSREKRVYVRTGNLELRTYYTLTQLEQMLPADLFLRIHESCIVNLEAVEQLLFLGNHSYAVMLRNQHQLPVGRSRYADLQRRLGLSSTDLS